MHEKISFESRMILFVASFSPMWFILIGSYLIDNHSSLEIITSFCIVIFIIGTIIHSCSIVGRYTHSTNMEGVELQYARDVSHKYVTHLVAYIFFVLIDITSNSNIFILVALAIFVSVIFSRTNLIFTNLAFFLVGFKIYDAEILEPTRRILLLSREEIGKGDAIFVKSIAPDIYIDKAKY